MLSLENMALVAPVNEVAYYYATTVGSAGRDSDWITSFKVRCCTVERCTTAPMHTVW